MFVWCVVCGMGPNGDGGFPPVTVRKPRGSFASPSPPPPLHPSFRFPPSHPLPVGGRLGRSEEKRGAGGAVSRFPFVLSPKRFPHLVLFDFDLPPDELTRATNGAGCDFFLPDPPFHVFFVSRAGSDSVVFVFLIFPAFPILL